MPDYTQFKSVSYINQSQTTDNVRSALNGFFNWGFLNIGAFTSVRLNDANITGVGRDVLKPVNHPSYSNKQVWKTPFQNLVWESGLNYSTQPTSISGVYINNVFKLPTSTDYPHYVDYNNGYVIFQSGINTNSVRMEYSYKQINLTNLTYLPHNRELQTRPFELDNDNYSSSSGMWSKIGSTIAQLPIVGIDIGRSTYEGYELGGVAHMVTKNVTFHIFDNNEISLAKIGDIIALQNDKVIYTHNIDMMNASGDIQLDYRGAKTNRSICYPTIVDRYKNNKLYLKEISIGNTQNINSNVYYLPLTLKCELKTLF